MDFIKVGVKAFLNFIVLLLSYPIKDSQEFSPPYLKYSNEIIRVFAKEMQKEKNLVCYGSGGSMPNDVEKITIMFISHQKANIEEARELGIYAVEKFLSLINSHEKIHPYLREFPPKSKVVSVSIGFENESANDSENNVESCFLVNEKIRYYDKPKSFTPFHEEPYEEALRIVQNKSPKVES